MKHWLMLQDYESLNTMYRKTPQKQMTFISPIGNEKQIDYILTKRRYLRYNKDAEANDMIHMGSDHRCVMATFTITMPGKNNHYKNTEGKQDMMKHERCDQRGNNIEVEKPELEKRYPRYHRKNHRNNATTKNSSANKVKMRSTSREGERSSS